MLLVDRVGKRPVTGPNRVGVDVARRYGEAWTRRTTLTFGLEEDSLLNTGLQGAVEEGVELLVGSSDLVVGLDIFLQALTAVNKSQRGVLVVVRCLTSGPESRWLHATPVWGMKHVVRAETMEAAYLDPLRSLSCRGKCRVSIVRLKRAANSAWRCESCVVLPSDGASVMRRAARNRPTHAIRCAGRRGMGSHT